MSKYLIFALFILLVVFIVRWQGGQYQAFMGCAAKTTGKIIAKEEKTARPSTDSGRIEYTLTYSYSVDGVEYSSKDTVEFTDIWLDIKEGQEIDVYYSKKDHSKSYPVIIMDRRLGGAPASFGDGC